jgi:hypothetical protein
VHINHITKPTHIKTALLISNVPVRAINMVHLSEASQEASQNQHSKLNHQAKIFDSETCDRAFSQLTLGEHYKASGT